MPRVTTVPPSMALAGISASAFQAVIAAQQRVAASASLRWSGTGTEERALTHMYSRAVPSSGPPRTPARMRSSDSPSSQS